MKARIMSLAVAFALVAAFLVAPGNVAAQENPFEGIPIAGDVIGGGTFDGTLDITRFAVQNGEVVAIGTITGTLTDALGNVTEVTDFAVAIPVDLLQSSGTCEILDLVLGPLNLDILGLVVDLQQVDLTITAEQGSGNLLGNLLCAVARLLDNPGSPLGGIAALLNRILSIFG